MTKCRLFWLAYAACVGLAVFWGIRLLSPRHRINWESYEKIQVGMSLEEVEAILGAPAGDYSTRNYDFVGWPLSTKRLLVDPQMEWIGNDCRIGVTLDAQGNVAVRRWGSHSDESFFDRVRRWFGVRNYRYYGVLRIR